MHLVQENDVVFGQGTLPRAFPRPGALDFENDGIHLHPVHYRTIRAAVQEAVAVARYLPRDHLPAVTARFALEEAE